MKRRVCCEEWDTLKVGGNGADLTYEELSSLLTAWKVNTGLAPSGYFDLQPGSLTPKFWCGTIASKLIQFEVCPIGSNDLNETQRKKLDQNLSILLSKAASGHHSFSGQAELEEAGSRFEALLLTFCEKLKVARRRQVLRKYQPQRDSISYPKGRLVFPHQSYESVRRPGRFYCEWVALTEDIPENRILKAILLRFRPVCHISIKSKLDELLVEFDNVVASNDLFSEWGKIRFDKMSPEYTSLLHLGKNLLEGNAPGLFSGGLTSNSEVIFTSRIFEAFVATELSTLAKELNCSIHIQERGKFLCTSAAGHQEFELIPDIRICGSSNESGMIIDSKWKHLDQSKRAEGVVRDDLYQVLIYASKHQYTKAALIYPCISPGESSVKGSLREFKAILGGQTYTVMIARLPMMDDKLKSVRSFLKELLPHPL